MYTINLEYDILNPNLETVYAPVNTPFCIKLDFLKGGEPLEFDELAQETGVLVLKGDKYRPVVKDGVWTNFPEGEILDETLLLPGGVDFVTASRAVLKCAPAKGSKRVEIYFRTTTDADRLPSDYRGIVLDVNALVPCENNPQTGGIELAGEYEDGEEFSFSINALDNSVQG